MNGRVNTSESLINVVSADKPKVLIGLGQKGMWPGVEASKSSTADVAPPADRRDLPHLMVLTWNVVTP